MVSESVERGATDNENHAPVGKTRRTAFWGIALLIVGAAIGFLLGSTSGDRSEARAPNRRTQYPGQEYPGQEYPGQRYPGQGASPWRSPSQPDERPDVAHSPAATDTVSDPTPQTPSLPAHEPGRLTGTIEFGGPGPRVPVDVTATRVAEATGEAKPTVGRTVAAASPTFAFRFVGLDPGSYILEVSLPLGASLATTTTTVVAGSNEIVLRARVPENGETLVLRAFAPNGEAIDSKELVVSVGREGTDGFTVRGGVSATRSDGAVIVPLVVPVSGAEVAFLNVQWLGHGAIRVPATDARDGEIVVRFPQRVTVTVRLDSRPPRGQRLGVVLVPRGRSLDAGAPKFYETWFDGGERRIEHAAPGPSDLVVVTATVASTSHLRELARHSVTVEARDNVFTLPVPQLGTLVLRTDALFAELYPAEFPRIRRRFAYAISKLGLIRFDAVPAGEWRVVAYKRDDVPLGEAIVRVPTPGILNFQPAARIEVAVRELDADGEAAKAGLKAGDVIVSVNAESLTTGFAWASRLRSLLKSPAVQIGVRRGDAMITLEVPGRVFDSRAVSGAVLRLQ